MTGMEKLKASLALAQYALGVAADQAANGDEKLSDELLKQWFQTAAQMQHADRARWATLRMVKAVVQ